MGRLSFDTPQIDQISGVMPILDHQQAAMGVVRAAWRHRGVVMIFVFLGMLGGISFLVLNKPPYTAHAILQLDVGREPAKASSIFSESESGSAASLESATIVQSEAAIIKSPLIVDRAVQRLGLADGAGTGRPNILSRMLTYLTDRLSPGLQPEEDAHQRAVSNVGDRILSNMSVETDSRSYLINILVSSETIARSVAIANAIADEYLKLRTDTNSANAAKTVDWLDSEIAETKQGLLAAQKDVARYRAKYKIVGEGTGQDDVSRAQFTNVQNELNAATLDLMNQKVRLAQLENFTKQGALVSAASLQSVPAVQSLVERAARLRLELADLKLRYQPSSQRISHAQAALDEVTSLLTDEVHRSVLVTEAAVAASTHRQDDLRRQLADLQDQAASRAEIQSGFQRLKAREQSAQDQLLMLQRNKFHATAVRDLQSVPASLIMPAEPVSGSIAKRIAIALTAAGAAGLAIGIMAAVLLERRNHGFRSSAELQTASYARCLGMIPAVPRNPSSGRRGSAQLAVCSEAVRSVGAEVGLFGVSRECRVILITSALADEGANTLCGALAEVLVAAGKRVMIIGGPMSEREAQDIASFSKTMAADSEQFSVTLPSPVRRNYSDLDVFRSERLAEVLSNERAEFDVILIEGPPVKLTADSLVLGQLADSAIQVVAWGRTDRHTVLTALQRLKDNAVDVDGVVLMGVDLARHARLGFVDECSYYRTEQLSLRQVSGEHTAGVR